MHIGEYSENSKKPLNKKKPVYNPSFFYKKWKLSGREVEILLFIADGLKSHEMALKLFISKRTIDYYRRRLRKKLGIKRDIELYREAVEFSLFWNNTKKSMPVLP